MEGAPPTSGAEEEEGEEDEEEEGGEEEEKGEEVEDQGEEGLLRRDEPQDTASSPRAPGRLGLLDP